MTGIIRRKFKDRLERAEAAYLLDEEMSEIKDEIQEAQKYYSQKRAKNMTNEVWGCVILSCLKVIQNPMH